MGRQAGRSSWEQGADMSSPEISLARAGRCRHDQSGKGTVRYEQLGADMSRHEHEQAWA